MITDNEFREAQKTIYEVVSMETKHENLPMKSGSNLSKGFGKKG